jgi:hypothetical protein
MHHYFHLLILKDSDLFFKFPKILASKRRPSVVDANLIVDGRA